MWWEDFDRNVPTPAILKPESLWTGKQVFNLIIPKQINLTRYSSWHNDNEGDTMVRIEKGELLTGTLCKNTLGESTGSLVHVICFRLFPCDIAWLLFPPGCGRAIPDSALLFNFLSRLSAFFRDD
ncbi:DNA-directed RNA polymerase II subunit 1-like [Arachis ipaensis]|uniref:DNA-directed RNA polymerase II subunit 1-like n=1 Tax=Arachis ipaensis TaxID=130454 RepID=UPI0007AF1B41|nr:DNA-directed RNA polymerase II subunit 1-like [Arachis ipaensis]